MKLKSRATGDKRVPQEERVCFEVIRLDDGQIKSHPLFFSKEWSVGKAVDYCAVVLGLENRNNIPSVPVTSVLVVANTVLRLLLFSTETSVV
jgi:hypothetical protein